MDIPKSLEDLRFALLTSEALGYTRLPNNSPGIFLGRLTKVRENLTLVLADHPGDELPVIVTRVTEGHMRQLFGLVMQAHMHKPANGLNVKDAIILGQLCKDYFEGGKEEGDDVES